jgi:hypothetical protein
MPRSGTSMMMLMLKEGGIEPIYDADMEANEANPNGFFETKKIRTFSDNTYKEWMDLADGKSIKVVFGRIQNLPQEYDYKMIIMSRNIKEVIASRRILLKRKNNPDAEEAEGWFIYNNKKTSKNAIDFIVENSIPNITVDYNKLIKEKNVEDIVNFLGIELNKQKMIEVIDESLYRNRI